MLAWHVTPVPAVEETITPTAVIPSGPVTINYTYDPLNRLTAADYLDGRFYHYSYDAVGNRLTAADQYSNKVYAYDSANRLTIADGVSSTFDANGNLLNDGTNIYTYDPANRLASVSGQQITTYTYNGLGNRLGQTVNGLPTNYTLDLNAGLTQVLSDGTNTYTYGLGRISQVKAGTADYFLDDALGSVRQLTNQAGTVTDTKTYDPYGVVTQSMGTSQSAYGFTGEMQDASGLTYLRARYYDSNTGRFTNQDTFSGYLDTPQSQNSYQYALNNPVIYTDPSGNCPTCFVFYFSGAGNIGLSHLTPGEQKFITQLGSKSGATVIPIYPYDNGNSDPKIKSEGSNAVISGVISVVKDAYMRQFASVPATKAQEIYNRFYNPCDSNPDINHNYKITLIGYSGGSQVSYTIAQDLTGKLFVDNLVALGPTYLAYAQMGNIGRTWEMVGYDDDKVKTVDKLWHGFNSGYRPVDYGHGRRMAKDNNLDIYQHGATRCLLLGTPGHDFVHYRDGDVNDYFDFNNGTNGFFCGETQYLYPGFSRAGALVDFLTNVVGVGRPK